MTKASVAGKRPHAGQGGVGGGGARNHGSNVRYCHLAWKWKYLLETAVLKPSCPLESLWSSKNTGRQSQLMTDSIRISAGGALAQLPVTYSPDEPNALVGLRTTEL